MARPCRPALLGVAVVARRATGPTPSAAATHQWLKASFTGDAATFVAAVTKRVGRRSNARHRPSVHPSPRAGAAARGERSRACAAARRPICKRATRILLFKVCPFASVESFRILVTVFSLRVRTLVSCLGPRPSNSARRRRPASVFRIE